MVRRGLASSSAHTLPFLRVLSCIGLFFALLLFTLHGSAGAADEAPPVPAPAPAASAPLQGPRQDVPKLAQARAAAADRFTLLAWNDLGMHCYNRDFQDLAVLPPYNNLYAQVVRVGNPPQIVTTTVTVDYAFPDNTYSVGKSNFWDFEQALFGVELAPNIGLGGKGLDGAMDAKSNHFVAEGIPLTEYSDSAPTTRRPFQLATVVARAKTGNAQLAQLTTVAPVSTEMRCDKCHSDGGEEGISTGRVETNILTLHDKENSDEYPPGHETPLMQRRPVLCAECHASNALGAPGVAGLESLSRVMHSKHAGESPDTTLGCYNCHPGPETKCLRDVMSQQHNMGCVDCHGGMQQVSQNPTPWLKEPRCDTCHTDAAYAQNQPLYRNSTGHGGIYCAACHDSPHAIAPSREVNDSLKFIALQGRNGPLVTCTVCHLTTPDGPGPHGMAAPPPVILDNWYYLPAVDQ